MIEHHSIFGTAHIDRPASVGTAVKLKDAERKKLTDDIKQFLNGGGEIIRIEKTQSKSAEMAAMLSDKVELISMTDIAKRWGVSVNVLSPILSKWPTVMYIMRGTKRYYALADIKRLETQPGYKMHKAIL